MHLHACMPACLVNACMRSVTRRHLHTSCEHDCTISAIASTLMLCSESRAVAFAKAVIATAYCMLSHQEMYRGCISNCHQVQQPSHCISFFIFEGCHICNCFQMYCCHCCSVPCPQVTSASPLSSTHLVQSRLCGWARLPHSHALLGICTRMCGLYGTHSTCISFSRV